MDLDDGVTLRAADDPTIKNELRRAWIADRLDERLGEFGETHAVDVVCATWNANGKDVTKLGLDLAPWLRSRAAPADVYAIGAQEMVDLTVSNVALTGAQATKRAEAWCGMIESALGSNYTKLACKHLVGCFLAVYAVARPRAPGGFCALNCRDVAVEATGTGALGVMGNKGACCIRLKAFDSTLCFVSSHLAAHRDHVAQRNADFKAICDRTEFKALSVVTGPLDDVQVAPAARILDHDVVFWLGDLNYRIRSDVAVEEVFRRCDAQDYAFLQARDQLNLERKAGRAFSGFREGELAFPVTYKYQQNTSILERRPEKKLRAPAWCDRVLWRTKRLGVRLEAYGSAPDLLPSDHKPVAARLRCDAVEVFPAPKRKVATELAARLAEAETSEPFLAFAASHVDFGRIQYAVAATKTLTISHVSGAAHWRVAGAPKSWLAVEPSRGTLLPGETVSLQLTVRVDGVDGVSALRLNAGSDVLEDLVQIHVEGGSTSYVRVSGDWTPSAWGNTLDALCAGAQVPPQLWLLAEALRPHLNEPDLFSGGDEAVAAVRAAVDAGAAPTGAPPRAVAAALTSLLSSLAVPVCASLPPLTGCDENNISQWAFDLLEALPNAHYNVFVYVLALLREVLSKSWQTTAATRLAAVARDAFLPSGEKEEREHVFAAVRFLLTSNL